MSSSLEVWPLLSRHLSSELQNHRHCSLFLILYQLASTDHACCDPSHSHFFHSVHALHGGNALVVPKPPLGKPRYSCSNTHCILSRFSQIPKADSIAGKTSMLFHWQVRSSYALILSPNSHLHSAPGSAICPSSPSMHKPPLACAQAMSSI